jgi:hypothetical protein
MSLKDTERESVHWVYVAKDTDQWRVLLDVV